MRNAMLLSLGVLICLGAIAQDTPDPNWPDGFRLVCELAPADSEARSEDGDVGMLWASGSPATLRTEKGDAYEVRSDPEEVVIKLTGLTLEQDHVIGFEWWDADGCGRRQAVQCGYLKGPIRTSLLPPTAPISFHGDESTYARILLPLQGWEYVVQFKNEGGPDAVVGKVWLLERVGPPKEKRVLIVTGDDFKGHLWRETGPELAEILREDPRFEVSITESPAILGSHLLTHYDAVILHFKNYAERLPVDPSVFEGLQRYLQNGGGLVVAHFGCGAFQEWDGMVKTIGRVWNPEFRGHDKYGPFEVRIADAEHAVTRTMKNFTTEDELYTCLDGEEPIHVLCDAVSNVDGKTYPMGLIPENSKGRVFLCTLGHDVNSLQSEGARTLYRRAVAWAAGLEP